MPFKFQRIEILPDLIVIEPVVFGDNRGFFMEFYNYKDFAEFGIKENFIQDNHSKSSKNIIRGLHWQTVPMAQSKIIRCTHGEIFDVVVDIRKGSPTFCKWVHINLSEENKKMLYIPKGFAHGFAVLSEEAEIIYKVDSFYSPMHDRGIIWNDPKIGIHWPISNPILSEKDRGLPTLKHAEIDFVYNK